MGISTTDVYKRQKEERASVRAEMNRPEEEEPEQPEAEEQPEPEPEKEEKPQKEQKPERPKPQIDVSLDDMEEEKKEPITLELPSIKFFTETEAQKQEAERQRIMEQAVREARNTRCV